MSHPVISVEHLSKAYRIGVKEEIPDTLMGAMKNVVTAPWKNFKSLRRLNTSTDSLVAEPETKVPESSSDTLWALQDVSFEINQGDVVGIIGRNGAGKSTLLKVLSRITEPTNGRVVIRGRVSSLLEVGTGFHPELTGRENVYMNGTILGMSKKEIDRKFDEIVNFSGVEKFLDTPTKRYSSGMQVRLAFAVAAHLEPEILIVDEVLAVGDAEFQKKCIGKIKDVAQGGRTVLLVSHNMSIMETICSDALQFKNGVLARSGIARDVLRKYTTDVALASEAPMRRPLNFEKKIDKVEIVDANHNVTAVVRSGDDIVFRVYFDSVQPLPNSRIGIRIDSISGARMLHYQSDLITGGLIDVPNKGHIDCIVPRFPLMPGTYSASIAVFSERRHVDHLEPAIEFMVEMGDFYRTGRIPNGQLGQFLSPAKWLLSN